MMVKGNKMKAIKRPDNIVIGDVDESTSLVDMQQSCPTFFRNPSGKRETYTIYRGQLIVRCTVQFTGCKPERKTIVYLFFISGEMKNDTFCVSAGSKLKGVRQAKKLIDKILDGGIYYYGI
jgi:hypothetical protein